MTSRAALAPGLAVAKTSSDTIASWTLIVALAAVLATMCSIYFVRKTGRETSTAARRLAEASEKNAGAAERAAASSETSAAAAARSAEAAGEAVQVSRTTSEAVAKRADADALAARYQNAAELLGHASGAVRLAGVHALSRLAGDWPGQRSSCVDLLCAYLRIKRPVEDAEQQVRNVVLAIISDHVGPASGDNSWSSVMFNLRGAHLVDVDFRNARLGTPFNLDRATFAEYCDFDGSQFDRGLQLSDAVIQSGAHLSLCAVSGQRIIANRMTIQPNGVLSITPNGLQEVQSTGMEISGLLSVHIDENDPTAGYKFSRLHVAETGTLQILTQASHDGIFTGKRRVIVAALRVDPGGHLDVDSRLLDSGVVQVLT